MPCKLDECKCVGDLLRLRMFCEHWSDPEQPRDKFDATCDANWATVPLADRTRCLDHLRSVVPAAVIDQWREQYNRGNRIGSDHGCFHLDVGMQVRNALRAVLKDDQLPGAPERHWDDYYMGALNALVST